MKNDLIEPNQRGASGLAPSTPWARSKFAGDIGLSAALFAPGWVHEITPEKAMPKMYEVRQQEFWDSIESCCSGSLASVRRHSLPFRSDFNPGCHPSDEVHVFAPTPTSYFRFEGDTGYFILFGFALKQAEAPAVLHRWEGKSHLVKC